MTGPCYSDPPKCVIFDLDYIMTNNRGKQHMRSEKHKISVHLFWLVYCYNQEVQLVTAKRALGFGILRSTTGMEANPAHCYSVTPQLSFPSIWWGKLWVGFWERSISIHQNEIHSCGCACGQFYHSFKATVFPRWGVVKSSNGEQLCHVVGVTTSRIIRTEHEIGMQVRGYREDEPATTLR